LVDETFSAQTVELPVGQVMELRLQENPTTGFRWVFAEDGVPCFSLVSDAYEGGGAPGAGGEHKWQMKAVQLGNCELRLFYRRSFEPDASPARSFVLHVKVTG
ncbi:MAG TPA: protease inhibitor I42 family protein, partial [Stellaceae bacterium]|nr:protease inhibitor I42 family protein [Stellaceae bacterium]